ncbi:unnamed protein product [Effrenium voratum]|nr:unnamed protein product [Effrenium voratum]
MLMVLLLRSDPPEPTKGSTWHHPCLLRAGSLFEETLVGTTCLLRRSHFQECPFPREAAENHWLALGLEPRQISTRPTWQTCS